MYPEEGRVLWEGRDVRGDLRTFHCALAYLGHEPPLKAELSARENLRYWIGVRHRIGRRSARGCAGARGRESLERPPGAHALGGQRRRVALAGLILSMVPLWLLDEPTTNLDTEGQQLVGSLIAEQLARGGMVVAAVTMSCPRACAICGAWSSRHEPTRLSRRRCRGAGGAIARQSTVWAGSHQAPILDAARLA